MEYLEESCSTVLKINLDNLAENIRNVKNYVGVDTLVMAIVKANGYGHGATTVSKVFLENGADRLGVSILREGIELRSAGIEAPILLLNYIPVNQYRDTIKYNLTASIYRYEDAKALSDLAVSMDKSVKIHIKIDTGMSRIGFVPSEESIGDIIKIWKLPNIEIEGIFTHFAKADEEDKSFAHLQFQRFMDLVNELEKKGLSIDIRHVANSATTLDLKEYKLDMVRPGSILYGYYPSLEVKKENIQVKAAMTFKTKISNVKYIEEGTGVGYNHAYIAKERVKIATIPVGYADGYSRVLLKKAYAFVNGKRAQIVGKICMDQMMINVSHIDNIEIGDEVKLFGHEDKDSPSIDEVASWIGTLNIDVLCMISRRVPRVYYKNNKCTHVIDYILD